MKKWLGVLLLLISALLLFMAGATVVAMGRALRIDNTLAAIESTFGSLVIAVLLVVLSRLLLKRALLCFGVR
ncbi:hypothetical protein ACXYTJ_00810 [Gilvimarinus sp. F26214L]|uniref:hypothetical protein n=1 Tax=Gilvimarinus sp. DZF01 TaxID=3461371 RepID=UPI00404626FB